MSIHSLSVSIDSFRSINAQPPDNLSPLSKIRHYQTQIWQAHSLIDTIEVALEEVQEQEIMMTTLPPKYTHQKVSSLRLDTIDSDDALQIKSYTTPRECVTKRSIEGPQSLQGSHARLSHTIMQMQSKHSHFLSAAKVECLSKSLHIGELRKVIEHLQSEIHQALQQRAMLQHQESYNFREIEGLQQEIRVTGEQLQCAVEAGDRLEEVNKQIEIEPLEDLSNSNKSGSHKQNTLKRKRNDWRNIKSTRKLTEKVQQLKQEIQEIVTAKQAYQKFYEQRVKQLEVLNNTKYNNFQNDIEQIKMDQITPSKQLDCGKQRVDTLDDLRLKTDISAQKMRIKTDTDTQEYYKINDFNDNVSVRSFGHQTVHHHTLHQTIQHTVQKPQNTTIPKHDKGRECTCSIQ